MRQLTALAALSAACSIASAQSVTLYGIADTGVEYLTNVNAQRASLTRMPNLTGTVPSRFGLRGTEDLGGGLQAFFTLESGFGLDTGSLNNGGRMFGRAANVGLATPYGRVTLGRQISMTVLAVSSHVMGPALYSFASHDPYIPNAIIDNTVGYVASFSGVTLGGTYSMGRDTSATGGPPGTNCPGETDEAKRCRHWSAMMKYDAASFGAALSHDVQNGGPGAGLALNASIYTDKRTIVSGWARLGATKISGGVLMRKRTTATLLESTLYYAGVSHPITAAFTLDAELSRLDVDDSANDSTMVVLRGVYALSKRTSVYAMTGQMRNKGTSANSLSAGGTVGAGLNQSGVMVGLRHVF